MLQISYTIIFFLYYQVNGTYYATVYDNTIIRICDLFPSLAAMPMNKRFDAQLQLYVNTLKKNTLTSKNFEHVTFLSLKCVRIVCI